MALLSDVNKDTLLTISRYMDELMDGEEVWRLFIAGMSRKIYTTSKIEEFAEENLNTRGSPSLRLLADIKSRGMSLFEFLEIMKRIKCTKVVNLFLQTTTPVITEGPPPTVQVMNGEVLSLVCKAECRPPPPSYQWYWENNPLPGATSSTLIIGNCNISHSGLYYCIVKNPCIEDSNSSTVQSRYTKVDVLNYPTPETASNSSPPSPSETKFSDSKDRRSDSVLSITPRGAVVNQEDIRITVHPDDVTCRYNEEFTLKCTAISLSGASLDCHWMIGRSTAQDYEKSRSDNTFYLKKKYSRFTTVEIHCVVFSDNLKVMSNKAKVTVKSVWIEKEPCSFHGYIGQIAILECEAAGKSPIEYIWFKVENGKKTVIQNFKESGILEFPRLTGKDWGSYLCQAQNAEGFVASKQVEVRCEPYREKVYIAVHPRSHVCLLGSSITLFCEAVSPHEVTFQWYHNNRLIESENGDVLILSPIRKEIFGSYYCVITSGPDEVKSDVAEVVEGVKLKIPQIINKTQAEQYEAEFAFTTADQVFYAREKVALLIGNQHYNHIKSLSSPHSDVKFLSESLKSLDFKVFSFADLQFQEIMQCLGIFCKLLDAGVYCVFYYSGHGFNYQNVDYIMPVDVTLPIKCDYCIPVDDISYRLQMTKCKVLMFLDCCRVNYGEDAEGPSASYVNECGYANVCKIWSCSKSKPAYERTSEQCSVFNRALREALTESISADNINSKILDYMHKNALAKDGNEFQRPIASQNLIPPKLTLHDKVMFDEKTSSDIRRLKEFNERVHNNCFPKSIPLKSIPNLKVTDKDLNDIAFGEVNYTFCMTNVLRINIKLTKKLQIKNCCVKINPVLTKNKLNKDVITCKSQEERRCIEFEGDIHLWEKHRESLSAIICINLIAENGKTVNFSPTMKVDTFWSDTHL